MNEKQLRSIVSRSASFDERCNTEYEPVSDFGGQAQLLMNRWRKVCAASNDNWFKARLSWDHLDETSALRIVAPVRRRAEAGLPEWTELLVRLVQYCREFNIDETSPVHVTDRPYGLIFTCWSDFAVSQLKMSPNATIAEGAVKDLQQLLKNRFDELCSSVLQELGQQFVVALRKGTNSTVAGQPTAAESRAFLKSILDDGCSNVFHTFALMARLLCTMIGQWIDFVHEFASRLASDQTLLRAVPWLESDEIFVVKVDCSGADVHARGRAVLLLTLSSGAKLVYKPRSVGVDSSWATAVEFVVNDGGFDLKAAGALDRGDYGWVEFIHTRACPPAQVSDFFSRAGSILALVFVMRGHDFHHENVISCGEYPVLVDMEGLFHPEPQFIPGADNASASHFTILNTCLLPCGYDFGRDIGGFSNGPTAGDDSMAVLLSQHSDSFVDGFTRMYRYLMINGSKVVSASGIDDGFRQRFLFRNTVVYSTLLKQLSTRNAMADSAVAIVNLEALSRAFVVQPFAERVREILRAERRSMINYDIPMFTTLSNSRSLFTDDGIEISDALAVSPSDQLQQSILGLSESDLQRQLLWIRAAVSLPALNNQLDTPYAPFAVCSDAESRRPLDVSLGHLRERVIDYCEDRLRAIVENPDSPQEPAYPRWTLSFDSGSFCYKGPSTVWTLFDGLPGIALFAAAASRTYGSCVGARIVTCATDFFGNPQNIDSFLRLGGVSVITGVLGPAYVLAHLGRIGQDPALVELSAQIARQACADQLDTVQNVGLYAGRAGVISALTVIATIADDETLLQAAGVVVDQAMASADVEHLVNSNQLFCNEGRPLWGVATGAAGLGCAFVKFGTKTGRTGILDLGIQLIETDIARFGDSKLQSLLRKNQLDQSSCFGAAGLAAVVNAVQRRTDLVFDMSAVAGPDVHSDVRAPLASDQVCVGELGRAEQYLHNTRSRPLADAIVAGFLTRYELSGKEICLPGVFDEPHPGLFQGIAGIGYQLLRSLDPEEFPSFLLLD
jgi:lantibiotic modifying enzyme